ncbi:hypothetical protein BDP55DRAFT_638844 [Colletotrichum godetiae]|uniref:Uncharacterized protein n=1 Tax=Colletotrichum godetiae TaxID=1209918 RepID=A0AAJ0EMD1_9PEZI|nr:uncharacterized protein BDP55DRAFT_638844 [Colletotrichum godetiae]KAK1657331.1 hypothetical protein BDP55DRAFT_638844 [Colletotrichum godetiae]
MAFGLDPDSSRLRGSLNGAEGIRTARRGAGKVRFAEPGGKTSSLLSHRIGDDEVPWNERTGGVDGLLRRTQRVSLDRRGNVEKSKPPSVIVRMELDVPAAWPRSIAMRSHAAVALYISQSTSLALIVNPPAFSARRIAGVERWPTRRWLHIPFVEMKTIVPFTQHIEGREEMGMTGA